MVGRVVGLILFRVGRLAPSARVVCLAVGLGHDAAWMVDTVSVENPSMLQSDLYRHVSRATGESVATVKRIGFLIADPTRPIGDPEAETLGPHVIDWDDLHAQQSELDEQSHLPFASF